MAWGLMASNYCLNQCCLIIRTLQTHFSEILADNKIVIKPKPYMKVGGYFVQASMYKEKTTYIICFSSCYKANKIISGPRGDCMHPQHGIWLICITYTYMYTNIILICINSLQDLAQWTYPVYSFKRKMTLAVSTQPQQLSLFSLELQQRLMVNFITHDKG